MYSIPRCCRCYMLYRTSKIWVTRPPPFCTNINIKVIGACAKYGPDVVLCCCRPFLPLLRATYAATRRVFGVTNQSINQRSSQSHTRAGERPHTSTTTGGANPASENDLGLGGYERVATALVCGTRSFSTPYIFHSGVHKTDGRHLRRRLPNNP